MPQQVQYTNKHLLPLYPSATAPTPKEPIKLAPGTYRAGQVVEETGTRGTYQALTDDANAQMILEYDIFVNASSQHFMGGQGWDETGTGDFYTSAYAPGGALCFLTTDLSKDNAGTPITAAIVTALKGVIITGTVANGEMQF
jgi:hypothetical protein